jgi:YjbE family integral membrane protein
MRFLAFGLMAAAEERSDLLDFEFLKTFHLSAGFLPDLIGIIIIDLVLAGDNAVVIAMAVRSLPAHQRRKGILFGTGAAVALRVILTFFLSQLLQIHFIKLTGGVLIVWIAIKLFAEGSPKKVASLDTATLWTAIKIILIADITMSLDNMLGVAAAAHGSLLLLLFGLGLSIPLLVFTSGLLSLLMDKYPVIVYIGAAVLGRVGGEMIITDPFIVGILNPGKGLQYLVEGIFTVGVIVAGKLWMRHLTGQTPTACGKAPDASDAVSNRKDES